MKKLNLMESAPEDSPVLTEDSEDLKKFPQRYRQYLKNRVSLLPRVRAVLGILHGLNPKDILDIGSGRGVFVLPFRQQFPGVPITVCEKDYDWCKMYRLIGVPTVCQDFTEMIGRYDIVTCLEVLEHLKDPQKAINRLLELADRAVIISVPHLGPGKKDTNSQHLWTFNQDDIETMFNSANIKDWSPVRHEYVLNHRISYVIKDRCNQKRR